MDREELAVVVEDRDRALIADIGAEDHDMGSSSLCTAA
jgi:hypothetical protein